MRKLLVAATAIAMTAAPAIASAQQAAAPARASEVQPASEQVEGDALRGKGYILPLIVVIGIIAALYLMIDDHEVDLPVSP
jgi:hypothetical protein